MSDDSNPRPRVAQVKLRLPWLYVEPGAPRSGVKPGEQGLVTVGQLRAMIRRVRRAAKEGRISDQAREAEIEQLTHGICIIEDGKFDDVGAWAPADEVIRPRARRR